MVTVSPASYSFAGQVVGSSSDPASFTLSNSGSEAVSLSGIALSNPQFSQTNSCGSSLAAGAHCAISVTFSPLNGGAQSATLTVNNNGRSGTQSVSLIGTGTGGLTLSPTSYNYPGQPIGSSSAPISFTLSNTEDLTVPLSGVAISNSQFIQTNTCGSSLEGGTGCKISVIFAPQKSGTQNATLSVNDSASGNPQTVSLTGAGTGGITISPNSYSFPGQLLGSSSAEASFTVSNTEAEAVNLSGISISDPQFAQTNNCGPTLAGGARCTISVTFAPQNSGVQSAALSISDGAGDSPQTANLSGTGIGIVTISSNSYTFPGQSVGSSSAPVAFTISNRESAAMNLSNIAISNSDFMQTSTCGSVAAGASCTIWVSFSPQAIGTRSATFSVTDSAQNSPQLLSLNGTGVGTVTVSPRAYSFPGQGVGSSSSTAVFMVSNSETSSVAISKIAISNAQFSQTNTCGSSLAPGANCAISVVFTPQGSGLQSATLSVNDGGQPLAVQLSGAGVGGVTVSPSSLAFGSQIVGRASTPQVMTVTNTQSTSAKITSITSTGSGLSISNNCFPGGSSSGVLGPGSSCSISVTFNPVASGLTSGSVTVANTAIGSPETLAISGTGIVGDTGPSLIITPQSSCIIPSGTVQFSAQVKNIQNTAVSWLVDGIPNGNSQSGGISVQGLYAAPSSPGTHSVEAVSQADTSLSATTIIYVGTTGALKIFPSTASIPISGQLSLQGQICGVPDSTVTWSVDTILGGNQTTGTVTTDGVYTAPNTPGQHTIAFTDTVQNKSKASLVSVYSGIDIDFGSRTNTQHPIRSGILGINHVEWLHNSTDMGLIAGAGITLSRSYAYMNEIYASQTPDWSQIDPTIADLQANGMHALLEVAFTPAWLQPDPNPCGTAWDSSVLPTSPSIWGQLAATLVAHLDAKFPGVVTDYEIWNEPDGGGLCGNSNLDGYLALYAAAAPAMKQQAVADRATIRVGGPAAAVVDAAWISALLSNSSTAPYVDFVSYHDYTEGASGENGDWDSFDGYSSLYQATQESEPADYIEALRLVSAGDQPGAANTPIYIDEYNTNAAFSQSCCRNNPIYSPVWNALYVTDLLNVVYSGQSEVPGQLTYYAANNYPYFCLIGTWDVDMDCQYTEGSTPVPYPQYYAYQLMSLPQYLGINSGGFMATSISPAISEGGPVSTAFYTPNQDSILIVNPTETSYSQIAVSVQNLGFTSPHATLFQIMNGQSIAASNLALTQSAGEYSTTVSVPPYSVIGISITGP